jgi:hypothetical protein
MSFKANREGHEDQRRSRGLVERGSVNHHSSVSEKLCCVSLIVDLHA